MEDDWEFVASFDDAAAARAAQQRLRSAGISANIEADDAITDTPSSVRGVRLLVRGSDAPEARLCLEDFDPSIRVRSEQFTATPQLLNPLPRPVPDDDIDVLSAREQTAERAFALTLIGLLCVPIQLYAFALLFGVLVSEEELRPKYRLRATIAAIINLPFVLATLMVLLGLILNSMSSP